MKTYTEAINKIAQDEHDNFMSGGLGRASGHGMVSFIYGVPSKRIYVDVVLERKRLWDRQIKANEQRNKK